MALRASALGVPKRTTHAALFLHVIQTDPQALGQLFAQLIYLDLNPPCVKQSSLRPTVHPALCGANSRLPAVWQRDSECMNTSIRVVTALALLACPPGVPPAQAGCRAVHGCRARIAVASPVVLRQVSLPYYYSVGAAVQEEALADRIALRVLARLEAAKAVVPAGAMAQTQGTQAEGDGYSLVRQHCTKCHGGSNAKATAALNLAGDLTALSGDDRLRMAAAVLDGKMPPSGALESDAIGNLLGQLVGATTAPK